MSAEAPLRRQVQREVAQLDLDAALVEFAQQGIADVPVVHEEGVEVVGVVDALRRGDRPDAGERGDGLVQSAGDHPTARHQLVQPVELGQAHRGGRLGHRGVRAGVADAGAGAVVDLGGEHHPGQCGGQLRRVRPVVDVDAVHRVVPVAAHPLRPVVAVEGDHAALAEGGDVLGGVEAEGRDVGQRTGPAAVVGGAERVGAVLDHRDGAGPGELHDGVHVRRAAAVVDQDHGPGPVGDQRLQRGRVHVQGERVDVAEPDRDAQVEQRLDAGLEGLRRHHDLVARGQVEQPDGDVQGHGPARHRQGVPGADVVGEGPLERLPPPPGGERGARGDELPQDVQFAIADDTASTAARYDVALLHTEVPP